MGTLYLIPTPLGKRKENLTLPEHTLECVRSLRRFIVENIRSSQSFLQWIDHPLKPHEPDFRVLNRKTPEEEIYSFLRLLKDGNAGLMSEAGAPAVADPGAKLVRMAHNAGYRVVPLSGPSSITLALMASGLNGQSFTFHGYLPVEKVERGDSIRRLEKDSAQLNRTEIFMETPYRNDDLFKNLVDLCRPETQISIACNLTMPDEYVCTRSVAEWRKNPPPSLNSRPALFLLLGRIG